MGFLETFVHTISREAARTITESLTQKEIERIERANKDPEILELERQMGVEIALIERLSISESYEVGLKGLKISRKQLDQKIFGDAENELQEASLIVTTIESSVREYITKGQRYGLNDSQLIESRIAIINKMFRLLNENLSLNPSQATRLIYLKKRLDDTKRQLLKFLDKEYY